MKFGFLLFLYLLFLLPFSVRHRWGKASASVQRIIASNTKLSKTIKYKTRNMSPTILHSTFLFLSLFLLFSSATSFNITKILKQYPDFSTFNDYLTQTKLASDINSRQTITVLVVNNGGMGAASGRPDDILKMIMSVHVVLDYYDMDKLRSLSKKSTLLTTLFQSSGMATNQQGFLNLTKSKGEISLGSAVPDASHDVKLVRSVTAQPFNISVLEISGVIVPPQIESVNTTKPKSPPPAATPTKAPSPKSPAKTPAATPTKAPSPKSPAKTPAATPTKAPSPAADASEANAPEADAPSSDGPVASDSPLSSPPTPEGEAPDADAADGPGASKDGSSSNRVHVSAFFAVVMGFVCMAAL